MGADLLIDDEWDPAKLGVSDVARTSDQAKNRLSRGGWDTVYLDNDLGPGHLEGNDLLTWLMYELDDNRWPKGFVVFTANNQARPRMESKLRAMGYAPSGKDNFGHVVWRRETIEDSPASVVLSQKGAARDGSIDDRAREFVNEGLVASMAEARRYAMAGVTPKRLKKMRRNKSQPLRARRDYGSVSDPDRVKKAHYDLADMVFIDVSGGGSFEVRFPDEQSIKAGTSNDAYALIQKYAEKFRKPMKIIDIPKGMTRSVDERGNIFDGKQAMRDNDKFGTNMAGRKKNWPGRIPNKTLEGLDIVSNIIEEDMSVGEPIKMTGEENMLKEKRDAVDIGQTAYVERAGGRYEVRLPDGTVTKAGDDRDDAYAIVQKYAMKSRKRVKLVDLQKGMTKKIDPYGNIEDDDLRGKLSSRLDAIADRLEMRGMREAAERLDVVSNTLETRRTDMTVEYPTR